MQRKNFLRVGGYGEEYMGRWGGEDSDMLFRAIASGLSLSRFEDKQFLRVIDHPNEDRVRNMVDEQGFESALADANKKSKRDKVRLMQNIFRYTVHNVQANKGSNFGIGRLHVGLEGESVDLGPANVARTSALNLTGFHLPGIVLDLRHPHIISAQEELKAFHQQPAI